MVYVLYGNESGLIEEYINNLKKEHNILETIKYNFLETSLEDIIEDALYIDMFGNKKLIIVNDFNLEETDILEKYIENKNENTILLFIINKEKLDERKKIIKLFRKNNLIKEFNKLNNYSLEEKILNEFKNDKYNIDSKSIKELMYRCKNEYSLIKNEIIKLKLYKIEDRTINYEDVLEVVSKPLEDDIFKLTDAVKEKNKRKIFDIYNDIINSGEDPIKIIVMLANEFRLIYQIKILNKTYNEKEISSILKAHPYRIKLALEKSRMYDMLTLEETLKKLSDLDLKIKSGVIDKNIGLELFLLEY